MKQRVFFIFASLSSALLLGIFPISPLTAQNAPDVPAASSSNAANPNAAAQTVAPSPSPDAVKPSDAENAGANAAPTPNAGKAEEIDAEEVDIDEVELETKTKKSPGKASASKAKAQIAGEGKSAEAKFRKGLEAYQKAGKKIRELQKSFMELDTSDEEKEAIGENLQKYAEYISKLYPKLLDLAEAAWLEKPSKDPEMLKFIVEVLEVRLATEDYESAQAILNGLLELKIPEILPDLYDVAGETAFMLNDFEKAGRYFAEAEAKNVLSERCAAFKNDLPYYRTVWAKERVLRERETQKQNLPLVKIKTSKGSIVLELFENEAPNTVANFIYLAEKGFYDGLYFESVIPGFCAESGRSANSADGGPGYLIRDEFDEKNSRIHARGTVSMANDGKPNTAGSRFFIAFSPLRQFDGKFVVFGRIVKGLDVLSKLQRIDPANPDPMAEPDLIEEVKVLRKQDHKYRPKVLKISTENEDKDSDKGSPNKKKSGKASGASSKNKEKSAY